MSAVAVRKGIYQTFMGGPPGVELFHGYTYSAHPLACAAGLATLELYAEEGLFARAKSLAPKWEQAIHGLKGLPHVIDIRNFGLVGAVELESRPGAVGARAYDCYLECFRTGLMVRATGDTIALSPPLIISEAQIAELFDKLAAAIKKTA
jgi:beta-alanine--pyruvate transaminase